MKSPVCWNAQCFVHVESDDRNDHYRTEDGQARLVHQRSSGMWVASIRGATGTGSREKGESPVFVSDNDVARRALNQALDALRRRVSGDQELIAAIDQETGE